MDDQYLHSYSILDLSPGAGWNELRTAYRSSVKKWHPDRFQSDEKRRNAEERTKEITRAYKILADFYRRHGRMPIDRYAPATAEVATPRSNSEGTAEQADHNTPASATEESPADSRPAPPPPQPRVTAKTVITVLAVLAVIYVWVLSGPPDNRTGFDPSSTVPGQPQVADSPVIAAAPAYTGPYFTHGSKIGDVYAIQGIPTATDDGVWYYGKSKVFFVNGSVDHWESHPENPLRAREDVALPVPEKKTLARGLTKLEVLALLGPPQKQTEYEWIYGSSRIFFSDGQVTGWDESPFRPLNTGR